MIITISSEIKSFPWTKGFYWTRDIVVESCIQREIGARLYLFDKDASNGVYFRLIYTYKLLLGPKSALTWDTTLEPFIPHVIFTILPFRVYSYFYCFNSQDI